MKAGDWVQLKDNPYSGFIVGNYYQIDYVYAGLPMLISPIHGGTLAFEYSEYTYIGPTKPTAMNKGTQLGIVAPKTMPGIELCDICQAVRQLTDLKKTSFGLLCECCSPDPQNAFFNQVKGKKIKANNWCNSDYFIPEKLCSSRMIGKLYVDGAKYYRDLSYNVYLGFESWKYCEGSQNTNVTISNSCDHTYERHVGLIEAYDYCTKCDHKKNEESVMFK